MSTRNEMSATLPRTSMSTIDENLKRFYDFIASICGMIVFSPLFLIIMILIKCDSKGPVIFSQERIGKEGKPFTLYKFRAHVQNPVFEKLKNYRTLADRFKGIYICQIHCPYISQ